MKPFIPLKAASSHENSSEKSREDSGTSADKTKMMRHSNSQALIPCQPLMIASRFDAQKARNAANRRGQISDTGGEMNSSIHFTMEDNSAEMMDLGSSSLN